MHLLTFSNHINTRKHHHKR